MTVSAAVFPKRKQNLMQTCCSFKSAIEKSKKTMTEAQEKNHTDPIDLSSRTPLGQLMRRAVTYTHQAGAGEVSPPEKNILLMFGSPSYISISSSIYYSLQLIKTRSCNYSLRAPDDGCQHPKHVELPTEM